MYAILEFSATAAQLHVWDFKFPGVCGAIACAKAPQVPEFKVSGHAKALPALKIEDPIHANAPQAWGKGISRASGMGHYHSIRKVVVSCFTVSPE